MFTGLLLTGVIAAIMSTADSQLLLGSAIATDDLPLIRRLARRMEHTHVVGASGRVWLGRGLLLAIGGAAGASAIIAPDSISNLVAYAWGGMGAAFGPVTILALYWRRFNFWGAMASIIVGAGVVTIWHFSSGGPWGMFDMTIATAPGFTGGNTRGHRRHAPDVAALRRDRGAVRPRQRERAAGIAAAIGVRRRTLSFRFPVGIEQLLPIFD